MSGRHRALDATGNGRQGDPIADPIASSTNSSSSLADRRSAPTPSGNNGAPQGTIEPNKAVPQSRIAATAIDRITGRLSNRDQAILSSVNVHQFLTVRHVEALHFDAIAATARGRVTRRALARLRELRVLDTLDRRIGGVRAGSQGLVYHVGVIGDRLLDRPNRSSARLRYEPSTRFVNHRLAIADTHVALIAAHRDRQIELTDSAVEPASWRSFIGPGAVRRSLKPDLYAETVVAESSTDDLVHAWFLEIDLGTEHIPTLLRKCRDYEAYRRSGIEQDRHGSFPLVIWSMTHHDSAKAQRRRQALAEAIAADRNLPDVLFRIVAPEQLLPLIQQQGAAL